MQVRPTDTAKLLETYTDLPLYLRARVEDWNVPREILKIGAQIDHEQVWQTLS
jgi:hypothetical protein